MHNRSYSKPDSNTTECPISFQCNCNMGTCRPYILFTNILLIGAFVLSLLPLILITNTINFMNCTVVSISQENLFVGNSVICLIYYFFVILFFNSVTYLEENIKLHKVLNVLIVLLFFVNVALTITSHISFCNDCLDNSSKNTVIFPLIYNYITIFSSIQYVFHKIMKK